MWRLVLAVSLLCCSAEASVSCKDENGTEVDWYILYKSPEITVKKQVKQTGLEYVYIYPDQNGRVKSETKKDITVILKKTLGIPQTQKPDVELIAYSDQPPEDSKQPGPSYAHSKGVVAVEKNKKGFWLLHSTPGFPDTKTFYPDTGHKFGQTFICVTFNHNQAATIGKHLQYINAYQYFKYPPAEAGPSAPEQPNMNLTLVQDLISSKGKTFKIIAKPVSTIGKPQEGDLYVAISKDIVGGDVVVQSWGRQAGRDCSFCPVIGKKVRNIDSVKPVSTWEEWEAASDHSKWCVAEDQNKHWTCIADMNRAKSQYKRRGGALCVDDADIAKLFRSFVKTVDECI